MIVIGLTGSIGMGKSTLARQLKQCGAAILDSDAVVHGLLAPGGKAVAEVAKIFPASQDHGGINRKTLGEEVFGDHHKRKQLEGILHPLVHHAQQQFLRRALQQRKRFAVLDIPLLFETGGEARCDVTIVASAPAFIQRRRVLKRMHMSEARFARILAAQMSDGQKRKRADFVVRTGLGKYASLRAIKQICLRLGPNAARIFPCVK